MCQPLTIQYYRQLSWYLFIQQGAPEHVDFKENLPKALTLFTNGASIKSNLDIRSLSQDIEQAF